MLSLALAIDSLAHPAPSASLPDIHPCLQASHDCTTLPLDEFRKRLRKQYRNFTNAPSSVLQVRDAISPQGCAALRRAVDASPSKAKDSVDQLPAYQIDLSRRQLEKLVGRRTVDALLTELPRRFLDFDASASAAVGPRRLRPLSVFVRKYSRDGRPWIDFHQDASLVTANIALANDSVHSGGRLVTVLHQRVQSIARSEGEATIHSSQLLHGVNEITNGVRYSLILFFRAAAVGRIESAMRTAGDKVSAWWHGMGIG